ncbi:MAG: hypothetical protein ACKN9J_01475 [Holophagaceae bacterium]
MHPKIRPLWIIIGARVRLGRWIAEDLAKDHDLLLTSSKSWNDISWHHGISSIMRTFTWDASSKDICKIIQSDLRLVLGSHLRIDGACFLSSTFDEQRLGTWDLESTQKTFNTNLIFPMLCTQEILPFLNPQASLHYFLDYAIQNPYKKRLPYSASKAGLKNFISGLSELVGDEINIQGHMLGTITKDGEPNAYPLHTPPQPFSSLMQDIRGKSD